MANISQKERVFIEKLRENLLRRSQETNEPLISDKYTQSDVFLIRWLRDHSFDLSKAEDAVVNRQRWRKENRIDEILSESKNEEMTRRCPYEAQQYDQCGRPVILLHGGKWNIKEIVALGLTQDFYRHVYRTFEQAETLVRTNAISSAPPEFVGVVDIDNLEYKYLGTKEAISTLLQVINVVQVMYPGELMNACYIINTPMFFKIIMKLIKAILPSRTIGKIFVYGRNKNEWHGVPKKGNTNTKFG